MYNVYIHNQYMHIMQVVLGNAIQGAVDEQCMRSRCSVHTMHINCTLVAMYMSTAIMLV